MKGPYKKPVNRNVFLFKVIAILLPFLFLLLLEVLLRTFHYGNDLRLFIEYAGNKDFLVLNPDASKRYFTNQSIATTGNREIFKKKKDANATRIFVLGESTTLGYPYFHNGSFHRWLQYHLMTNLYEKIAVPDTLPGTTRMQMMVAEEQISYGSVLYERGIGQFKSNMEEAVKLLHDRNIPVFISNLVSNEKDLRPFVSGAVD